VAGKGDVGLVFLATSIDRTESSIGSGGGSSSH
jgi:hypothetical protein